MSKECPVRILLADNHTLVRAGLCRMLEGNPEFTIVGEAGNRDDAIALAAQLQPDIILLELNLGDDGGLNVIPQLVNAASQARILLVTGINDIQMLYQAVQLGAIGIIKKQETFEVLTKAIVKVHSGEAWLDRLMMAEVISKFSRGAQPPDPETLKIALLSERERQVVTLIGQGLKNKQIAEQLFISETTVRHHLTAIFSKLQVSDRLELLVFSYHHGLVQPPN